MSSEQAASTLERNVKRMRRRNMVVVGVSYALLSSLLFVLDAPDMFNVLSGIRRLHRLYPVAIALELPVYASPSLLAHANSDDQA